MIELPPLGYLPTIAGTLIVLALIAAAVLQVAMLRDDAFQESKHDESYRWLTVGGFLGLAARYGWNMYENGWLSDVLWHTQISVGLIAIGFVGLSLNKIIQAARRYPGGRRLNDPPIRVAVPPEPAEEKPAEPRRPWYSGHPSKD